MEKITFVIPSRNNLDFLKLAYQSIKALGNGHEILVLDDASRDGTQKWIESLEDDSVILHRNPGPTRIGIVGMFDKGIEMARTDIIFAYHADMVAGPGLDVEILKHLKPETVVSATRVEPPLHPAGPEKITKNFGIEAEEFDFDAWNKWCADIDNGDYTTEGVFAPWCMYKEDFLAIGGHDELFAPQSKEDSDLFNRMQLAGYKFIQPWSAVVYHFTSRGSRFNKYSGGSAGNNSEEWIYTTTKNMRNFIRKWGHAVRHDKFMKPIIPPKYDMAIVVKNCNFELLNALEPWSTKIYTDAEFMKYITLEQKNTSLNLRDRCFAYTAEPSEDIEVRIDGANFNQEDFNNITLMNDIVEQSGQIGTFELGNLEIHIKRKQNVLINKKEKTNE